MKIQLAVDGFDASDWARMGLSPSATSEIQRLALIDLQRAASIFASKYQIELFHARLTTGPDAIVSPFPAELIQACERLDEDLLLTEKLIGEYWRMTQKNKGLLDLEPVAAKPKSPGATP